MQKPLSGSKIREKALIRGLIRKIIAGEIKNPGRINAKKAEISKSLGKSKIIRNSDILAHASASERPMLSILVKKPVRTISGVAVIAVMPKPEKCPGSCIYCPQGENAPKSYTGKEPAARRAKMFDYSPFVQVSKRLEQLRAVGHSTDKAEIIVMGGTFPACGFDYQKEFVRQCFNALNGCGSKSLKEAQKINEASETRCVGLTIETRPDFCKKEHINRMLELGATRVELGVQALSDKIYEKVRRGHTVKDVAEATQMLKDAGIKVAYHMMPGLFQSKKEDIKMFRKLFSNEKFRPDMLKIYPALVIKGTKLYSLWKSGEYTPLDNESAARLIAEIKPRIPPYCRIMRIQRDIPAEEIAAGVTAGNLRELVQKEMKKTDVECRCIRCREAGHGFYKRGEYAKSILIFVEKYAASKGAEYFISLESKDKRILAGYLRLRIPFKPARHEIAPNTAIVRELKVFGAALPIGAHSGAYGEASARGQAQASFQHKGLGKKLMKKAEELAKKEHMKKIAVIAAVGTREYYRALGYNADGAYMSKQL